MKIYIDIYLKNGSVYTDEVDSPEKAREHAEKIWMTGYRVRVGDRHEWFGPHYVDKIAWGGNCTLKFKDEIQNIPDTI